MSVRRLRPEERLIGPVGVAVCLIRENCALQHMQAALSALMVHTGHDVPILILGVSDPEELSCGDRHDDRVLAVAGPPSRLPDLLSRIADASEPSDLVLLSSWSRVPANWLVRLQAAALSGDTVATATPLGCRGDAGEDAGRTQDRDAIVAAMATRSYPRLQVGGPDCLYLRRRSLDLIGGFGSAPGTLPELAGWLCAACISLGLVNVLADDLYLDLHAGPEAAATDPGSDSSRDPDVRRLRAVDRSDERSPLSRALALSDAARGGLSVTVDARSLSSSAGGTQRYTLELILALARFTDARVRAVVAHDLDPGARAELAELADVEVLTYEQAVSGVPETHVVHRPQQVFSADDLNLLRLLGRRLVVTHQDLIAYHNPTYHESVESWEQYRRITRIALAAADRVVLFSEHSRQDVLSEDLVTDERCDVVGAALASRGAIEPKAPAARGLDRDFILCLGADYRHKNRVFALRLVRSLRAHQGWRGRLVLAGGHVPHGSSGAEERDLLAADRDLAASVTVLGAVADAEREWLLEHARAVLVPSVVEGFGLVPLEAAQAGVPCLFAAQASLAEVVSSSLATLVPWDPERSAAQVIPLLTDGTPRDAHVEKLRDDAGQWSWQRLAGQLIVAYERALRMPYRAAAGRAWQELERERYLVEIHRAHQDLLHHLGGRTALASDEGFLTTREQRGLLRVGARPTLARAVLWPFSLVGSIRTPRA